MRHASGAELRLTGFVRSVLTVGLILVVNQGVVPAVGASEPTLQAQGDALMKNVEDMLAHGGMGDAKAIVHHCEEATHYAETLKRLSEPDPMLQAPLNEVIRQCRRVSNIGVHADPGMLLNPAIKARAAARESIKALGLTRGNKG